MGWKIPGFSGFSMVRAASQLQVSAGLTPTPSWLTADGVPVAHTQSPARCPEQQLIRCRGLDEGLLGSQLCQQLREGCKSRVCRGRLFPRCAAQLPARSRNPAASPASCRSWTTASPVLYEWISSLFECLPPNPKRSKNVVEKHQKKHFCLLTLTL